MKIYCPNSSKQPIGGGFTFLDNFKKGAGANVAFVDNVNDCDVMLIIGATMTERSEVQLAKAQKKPVIFRVDNMPKDSRNRGTAFSRMRDFAFLADKIIFQSKWAKDYVGTWMKVIAKAPAMLDEKRNRVILNGVDTEIFNYEDNPDERGETYLFVQFNRDENKRFPEAAYDFHKLHMRALNQDFVIPKLTLLGQFSPELVANNFDFFAGEKIEYVGVIQDRKTMADIYREHQFLYFPAFADAAPNTVSEAMACGCLPYKMNQIGGSHEVADAFKDKPISIQEMANNYLSFIKE